jgi:putative thioredoxin
MAEVSHVYEGTHENFAALVLENSARGPVLVNYWAPWAGPCFKLWPLLAKLASEYGGRFLLVNVNTDRERVLARERGVNSLPTIQVYRHGQVLAEVHGAESEPSLRRLIERFVARASDSIVAGALEAYRKGRREEAEATLAEAARSDPANRRIPLVQAKLLLREGNYEGTTQILAGMPEQERAQPEVSRLMAHLDLLRTARAAPERAVLEEAVVLEPDDLDSRYRLAAVDLLQDDYGGAMDQLIEILRRGPNFREGAARRGLLALFDLLGPDHELVARYRARLFEVTT